MAAIDSAHLTAGRPTTVTLAVLAMLIGMTLETASLWVRPPGLPQTGVPSIMVIGFWTSMFAGTYHGVRSARYVCVVFCALTTLSACLRMVDGTMYPSTGWSLVIVAVFAAIQLLGKSARRWFMAADRIFEDRDGMGDGS